MSVNYPDSVVAATATGARPNESPVSAASWPAIFAGAFAAVAASLILVALGAGFGLASISPWPRSGASATTFTVMTAIWMVIVQWVSALLGGYIAGRLRTKWVGTHSDEVFFRDTANGFVTWAVATVVGAAVLTSAVGAVTEKGIQAATSAASSAAPSVASSVNESVSPYDVDRLLRSPGGAKDASVADEKAEVTRVLVRGIKTGDVSAEDRDYLSKLVSARAGISETDAQKRVDDTIAAAKETEVKARQAADAARKATAATSIFMGLSMLIGAFIASAAAALGGRLRDLHP